MTFLTLSAELGIIATAAALLMIAGEFDLSVGSMIGFAGVVIGLAVTCLGLAALGCIAAVAFAVAVVRRLRSTASSWCGPGCPPSSSRSPRCSSCAASRIGVTRAITGRTQIPYILGDSPDPARQPVFSGQCSDRPLPLDGRDMGWIATRSDGVPFVPGIPVSIVWWIGVTAVATWVLTRTRFGNWIFAAGGDAGGGAQRRRAGRPGEDHPVHLHRAAPRRCSPPSR